MHDFIRERPSKSPAKGWQVLVEALKDYNIPKEFIGNRLRWQYIQTLDEPTTYSPSTPASRRLTDTLRNYQALRRRLSFQSGSGIGQALKLLKWKTN